MSRGFSMVALVAPRTPETVGGTLRAAQCYGCSSVYHENTRRGAHRAATNTGKADLHMPVCHVDDAISLAPIGTQIVAVDLIDGAVPLPRFRHPERALYVFGPEDGTLGKRHIERAQHVVSVPTRVCMNLAACVNVVLYDRLSKSWKATT